MPTLLPSAEQQFCDGNGVPYAGGLVFFYVPGTTTPKDTFLDPGGLTKNQNPVILDASGRAIVYGTGSYRQVLKDGDGNVVWDQVTADTASSAASWCGTATGTANNIVLTATNFASMDGQALDFLAGYTNTGAVQATVNGTAVPVKIDTLSGPVQTPSGCIVAGDRYRLTYDATAGLLHLTPLIDKGYVDTGDASTLSAAQSYASAQAASALSLAEAYALGAASAAQSNAQSFATSADATVLSQAQAYAVGQALNAESYAAGAASSAQSNAISTAESYAAAAATTAQNNAQSFATSADVAVTASCNSYAASQASAAQNSAQSFATSADATVLSNASSTAQGYANTAQSNAQSYALTQVMGGVATAKSYSDGNLSTAQSNNAATYSRGVRLSGAYSAAYTGIGPGSVCTQVGSSSASGYSYLQYNINGTWVTAANA